MKKNLSNFFITLILFNLALTECGEGCLKCTEEDKCEICDSTKNYKIDIDKCEKVTIENCTFINQGGECLSCSNGFYIESTSRKCIAVDKVIENCEFYDSSQSCVLCKTDFFLDGLNCTAVETKIANCMYYILDEQCSQCSDGFLIDFDSKTCTETSSVSNCSYFSRVKCENCASGYIKNENYYFKELFKFSSTAEKDVVLTMIGQFSTSGLMTERVCEKTALTNCFEYETFDKCKVCAVGHFLGEDKKCTKFPIPVISNCQRYSSNTNCIECSNQFFLKNSSTCSAVTDIENCSDFDGTSSTTKCKLCKDEYYLSGSTCKLRENIIDKCDELNSNSDSCSKCAENFEKTNDSLKCLPLVPDCKEYSSSTKTDTELTCSVCKDAFILDQVECKSGTISGCAKYTSSSTFGSQTCEICNNQFWLDNNECKQIDPIANCLDYHREKDKSCVQCEEGYFNFLIESVCKTLTPIPNCITYTPSVTPLTCDACVSGYLPNEGKTSCLKIDVDNCALGSSESVCTKCKDDYALGTGTCHPILDYIGKNCQKSNILTTTNIIDVECQECKINSIPIYMDDHYLCVKNDNLALHFSMTVPSCYKYDDDGDCKQCIEGKYLNSEGNCIDTCSNTILRYNFGSLRRNFCTSTAGTCELESSLVTGSGEKCIKCSTDTVKTTDYTTSTDSYTNVRPLMGNDLILHPREKVFTGDCIAKTSKTFNEGSTSSSSDPIPNCELYMARAADDTKLDCIRCKDFHTGEMDSEKGIIKSCILDSDFEETKRYGLDTIWEKLFSGYVCKGSNTIPFVAYLETSSSDSRPESLRSFNPADQPFNGTLKKSNFCSLDSSDVSNQNTTIIANCGMGAYRVSATDTVQFICAACKPGFKPDSDNYVKTVCESINNCTGTEWFNSCSQCSTDHVHLYDSNDIDYTVCTSYSINENCYAADDQGVCKICKKGFNLNKDQICDSLTSPNCASSTSFNLENTLPATNENLKAFLFYKLQDTVGCGTCKTGYTLVKEDSEKYVCTESEFIKTNINDIDQENSAFIQYCESYSHAFEGENLFYTCNKCKAGKLLVEAKDKCVAEITDCEVASNTTGQCSICKVGYALKNHLCAIGEIENCLEYYNADNNTEITCKECESGFFLDSNDTKCTKSLVENCEIPNSLKKCGTCKSGYMLYEQNSYDYCYPLDPAYKCTQATISDNAEYGASITCTACELSNDIIVTDTADNIPIKTICLAYDKTPNCENHLVNKTLDLSSFHCNLCESDYFLDESVEKCTERVNLPSDCITYNINEDKCETCSESTFEENNGVNCTSFPVGIVGCNNYTSSSTCTGCMTNMFLSGKSCVAVADDALIKDCEYYQNGTTCKECKVNYFLSSNTCTKANVSNCEKLKTIDVCEICKPGYGLKDTAGKTDCVSVNQSKCLSFTPKDPFPCLICEEDYYPDTEGKCTKANPLITDCTLYKDNSTCVICKEGSVLSLDKKTCVKGNISPFIPSSCQTSFVSAPFCITCSPGNYLNNGSCTACGSNNEASGCFNCDPFNEEKCILCKSDYWMNKEGVCTAMIAPLTPVLPEEDHVMRFDVVMVFLLVLLFK